jgi:hypothetical protein
LVYSAGDFPPKLLDPAERESGGARSSSRCTGRPSDAGHVLRLPVLAGVAMRRISGLTAGPLLFLAAVTACRDGVVSPSAKPIEVPALVAPAPMSLAPQARPMLDLDGGKGDSASVDFFLGPNGGLFYTGNHAVVFPAQSVCDPATSSYGPSTWDEPCQPLQTTLKVHAEVRRSNGRTWVDFTPSLRFVPSSNSTKWVWMVMYTPEVIGREDLSKYNILWAHSIGGATVDETSTDASLRTYVDTFSGISLRRIKHFSGFTIETGKDCDAAQEGCGSGTGP